MVKSIYNYQRYGHSYVYDMAKIKNLSIKCTKLIPTDDLPITTWEIFLEIETFKKSSTYKNRVYWSGFEAFTVSETLVDIETEPFEYQNPEMLSWLSEEEISILHNRLVWISNSPLTIDLNEPKILYNETLERSWTVDEIEKILLMNEEEVSKLEEDWKRKMTYKKFGL